MIKSTASPLIPKSKNKFDQFKSFANAETFTENLSLNTQDYEAKTKKENTIAKLIEV